MTDSEAGEAYNGTGTADHSDFRTKSGGIYFKKRRY